MTKTEYLEKCKSVVDVLEKIVNGVDVPLETRLDACSNAIAVLCGNNHSQKPPRRHH